MFEINPKVDYGPQLNIIVWLLISISALFLFTRLYLKACQNRGLWWDDYFLLAAWLTQAAHAGVVTFLVDKGYGRTKIPRQNLRFFGVSVPVLSTLLIAANLLGKLSFALTLLRLPARWLRLVAVYIIVTLTLTLGFSCATVFVECSAARRKDNCIPLEIAVRYNMFSCVYSATMDVALAFLPWQFIWSLQMSRKEKVGVVTAMSMGLFAAGAAAMKTLAFPEVLNNPVASVHLVVWGNAESSICIMAASIPILRALVRGGLRCAIPFGYPTNETGASTTMAESAQRRSFVNHATEDDLDRTLTSLSPDLLTKTASDSEDWSDQDSIEMGNYHHRRPEVPLNVV
ncbi:hypothetical protein B0T18DRAFT_428285 [Schizothecium vesticola]|uniref:Rhodopsin domain-containing protein n=1 Tax=Schizothecium vesticola TaxID=314040 RepID=A0AA40F367_9PEZI|nr:hypothetical protein B0T18DRAFT_428285 [Schizothecium vesticola]